MKTRSHVKKFEKKTEMGADIPPRSKRGEEIFCITNTLAPGNIDSKRAFLKNCLLPYPVFQNPS